MVELGAFDKARARFQQALLIRERLAKKDPASADALDSLSVSFSKLGEVLLQMGDLDAARDRFSDALEIDQQLEKRNPSSIEAQRAVAISMSSLGDVLLKTKNFAEGRERLAQAVSRFERILAGSRGSVIAQRDLMLAYAKLAQINQGQTFWRKSLALGEAMEKAGTLRPNDANLLRIVREMAAESSKK
jgi:tetratricopeptide (TPR) repeat protein